MDKPLLRALLLVAAIVLAVWSFGLILQPFLLAISWALCLASVTMRPYKALVRRTGRPALSAGLMTAATALGILLPLLGVALLVVDEAATLSRQGLGDVVENLKKRMPGATAWADGVLADFGTNLDEVGRQAAGAASRLVPRIAADVVGALVGFLFTLLMMLGTQYFVYHDAPRLRAFVSDVLPLHPSDTDRLLETLHGTTFAALVGGLAVALLQGAIGAVGLLVLGIRAPVTWGIVMAFVSFIPVGGTALVWAPIVLYLFATGDTARGAILLGYGTLVLSVSDNLARPLVMRRAGAMAVHPLLLFFAILSGIGLFGMSGIVFGPLLLALLTALAKMYREQIAPGIRPQA